MIDDLKKRLQKTLEFLKEKLKQIRTGRANIALVENVQVEAYGAKMPMNQLATITVPEAKTILITPWDKANVELIVKAIQSADIGINPSVEGESVRLVLPPMTEERRKELVKVVKDELELGRISIRGARKEILQMLDKTEGMGEDEKERIEKQVDEEVKKANEEIERIGEAKEAEIMSL